VQTGAVLRKASTRKKENGRTHSGEPKMSFTDPVADFLTRIRNGIKARHQKVDAPASKLKLEIARVLKEEGYISNFKATEEDGKKVVRVYIKYNSDNVAAINNIKRISRPGCRVYVNRNEIPRILGGLGITILTTPKGVRSGKQARREGVGGEVICEVY
jgi:small subunit ribosomal protein S8